MDRTRAAATVAAVALMGAALAGCASAMRTEPVPIDPRVLEQVRSADSVDVVVVLVTPPSYYRRNTDRLRSDIRGMQDDVVGRLEPGTFRVRRRFASVPAMTLTVSSEATVRTLALLRHVARVRLDDGSSDAY